MAFYFEKIYAVDIKITKKGLPQVAVFNCGFFRSFPVVSKPIEIPLLPETINQIGAVGKSPDGHTLLVNSLKAF